MGLCKQSSQSRRTRLCLMKTILSNKESTAIKKDKQSVKYPTEKSTTDGPMNQPTNSLIDRTDIRIPAHQPKSNPIGKNYSIQRNYILCIISIDLFNNDLINLFNSVVNNNLFLKN